VDRARSRPQREGQRHGDRRREISALGPAGAAGAARIFLAAGGRPAAMGRRQMLRDDRGNGEGRPSVSRNVLGGRLDLCSISPMTGFFRDVRCDTGREDIGSHTACAVMTAAFLAFSNPAATTFPRRCRNTAWAASSHGDRWCLCAPRSQEALESSQAPRVALRATHEVAFGPLLPHRSQVLRRGPRVTMPRWTARAGHRVGPMNMGDPHLIHSIARKG
jgi:hypothetical protein